MPSVNVPGVGTVNFPDTMSQAEIINAIENDIIPSANKKPTERTWGEALTDIGAGLKSGAGSLLQLPGQISGVITGDYDKPGQETGLAAAGKELQAEAEAMKSPGLKAREQQRATKIAEAEKRGQVDAFFTAFSETVRDPGLLTNFLAEQAPQLIPSLGAARLIKPLAGTAAAVRGAVGTGAVQQGADIAAGTYEQVYQTLVDKGVSETQAAGEALGLARATGASAALISLLAQRLPGARAIEEAFAGQEGKLGRILGGVRGAAGEALSETAEETPAKALQNLALQQVAPETQITQGLGEVAAMAALGGVGLGGATGLAQRQKVEALPPEQRPEPVKEKEIPLLLEGKGAFVPVALPDGSVAMTREDLAAYEEEQFQKKFEPQLIKRRGDFEEPTAEEMPRPSITYGEATREVEYLKQQPKSPEVQARIQKLQTLKMDMLIDGIRRAREPVRPELVELRQQMESPVTEEQMNDFINQTLADFRRATMELETQKQPTSETQLEIKDLTKQANDISKQISSLKGKVTDRSNDLKTALRGTLVPDDVIDISPEKSVQYLAAKEGQKSYVLADLVADGLLDKWLPENMRHTAPSFDGQESEEYIKDLLRTEEAQDPKQRILDYDSKTKIDDLNKDLEQIQNKIKDLKFPQTVEERRDEAASLAEEVGAEEPIAIPTEETTTLEEPVEEEYFPDQDLLKEEGKGSTPEQARFVINKDPEHARIEKELTGRTMLQAAQWAVDNAPNQFAKVIAQKVLNRLNGMAKRGIKLEFEVQGGERRTSNMFSARGETKYDFGKRGEQKMASIKITLNGAAVVDNQRGYPPGTRYITVLHELLHAATIGQINVLQSDDPIVKELRDLFNKVVTHFNTEVRAGRMTPFMERVYSQEINPLTGPHELVAWGIADRDMQEFLSEIKVGEQTIMDKLVELIRKILNITKPYLTALDQLVKTTESILDEDVNVVGNKIISKQYSFGVKPGQGEAVQGTLFQQEGKRTPSQKAKAVAKQAMQKRKLPKSQFDGVDDEYYDELKRIFAPEKKTIIDKIEGMRDDFWQRLAQGIADQYRTIKDYSDEAYKKARMSKTVDGALEGILFNGEVKLTDGALDIAKDTKGLFKVLEPVGNEVDRYQIWVALNRDAELVRSGKAPSVDRDIVAERNKLSSGKIGDKSRLEVYRQVQQDMNKLNRSVLKIAYQQGVIDREAYKVYARDINYIPFYKMLDEDSDVQTVATKSGLVNQYFSKQLKGGEKPFGDLMENTLRNWSHILSAAMKNEAANATIRAAIDMGAAYPNLKVGLSWEDGKVHSTKTGELVGDGKLKPEYTTSGKGTIKTMIDGKPAYFDVSQDPLLLESIMSIGYMGPKSKFLDVARGFKNVLQFGVTLAPGFKVRNLFRDSVSAMAVTELKKNPFANIIDGWVASDKNNPAHISALAGGGIFNFGSAYEGDQARLIKRLLDSGVKSDTILDSEQKIKKSALFVWNKYQEWGNKSEAANRIALYKKLRESGASHLEASFQARDMLDFSMQGAWPAFRYLTQIVPFLNARVQGLYKLGRDGIIPTSRAVYSYATGKDLWAGDKERKLSDQQKATQFSVVMGAVALASLALYMAFKDDEEFKKREQWDRDNFWWFKLPGMDSAFRIPKPFEVGAFGTMAERTAEQIFDQGAEGKAFEQSLKRMLTDTFAINLPQVFKPLVDLYANKDSFTGAPIETAGMERLSKEQRIAEKTSPLAIALSKVTNVFLPESAEVSPVQTDYAIKAYFGWLGGTASWASHYAVQPFSKSAYPDNDWKETLSMGFVKSLPATQSRYVTAFYENNKEISQAYADMRHFAQLGQADKVQEIIKEKGDKIAMAKFYDNASKDMSKMRQVIQAIRNDEKMSGAQKKEEIDRIKILIGKLAEQMEEARVVVKKQYEAARSSSP